MDGSLIAVGLGGGSHNAEERYDWNIRAQILSDIIYTSDDTSIFNIVYF
jgi:hypothetical protein